MKLPMDEGIAAAEFTRWIDRLHACTTRDGLRDWFALPGPAVRGPVEILWGVLKRVDKVWQADWMHTPNAGYVTSLVADPSRLDRIVRFAAAGGGYSLVMLPTATSGTEGTLTHGVPRIGVAWSGDACADRGYLFIVHDPAGLGRELRRVSSMALPHLHWVTRGLIARERRARRDLLSVNLTKRERELLKEVVRGRPDREIAERSGRSHHTIKNQVRSILRKLGVSRRTQAAFVAERHNLIDTHIDPVTRWDSRFVK